MVMMINKMIKKDEPKALDSPFKQASVDNDNTNHNNIKQVEEDKSSHSTSKSSSSKSLQST